MRDKYCNVRENQSLFQSYIIISCSPFYILYLPVSSFLSTLSPSFILFIYLISQFHPFYPPYLPVSSFLSTLSPSFILFIHLISLFHSFYPVDVLVSSFSSTSSPFVILFIHFILASYLPVSSLSISSHLVSFSLITNTNLAIFSSIFPSSRQMNLL